MKALTLTQPWADLVALGAKTIETRSWRTSHRGPIAIHAGKRKAHDLELGGWTWRRDHSALWCPDGTGDVAPTGAVVAIAELVDVVPIVELYGERGHDRQVVAGARSLGVLTLWPAWLDADAEPGHIDVSSDLPFGDYTPGRFAWLLENVRKLDHPVPARGALHLWEWDAPRRVVPRLNAYACDTCHGFTVVVEIDEGHAPDVIGCRANGFGDCAGAATNMHYPDPWPRVIPTEPQWELYNPNAGVRIPSDENRAVAAAVDALILRKLDSDRITEASRA